MLATITTNANALSINNYLSIQNAQKSYQMGYDSGKSHAYNNIAKTVAIVGVAIVAGVIIYHAGKESRWGANKNGIVYKF